MGQLKRKSDLIWFIIICVIMGITILLSLTLFYDFRQPFWIELFITIPLYIIFLVIYIIFLVKKQKKYAIISSIVASLSFPVLLAFNVMERFQNFGPGVVFLMPDIMAILTLILTIISCFAKKEINETPSEPKWLNEEPKAIFHDSND